MENIVTQKGNSRLIQWLLFLSFLLPVAIWMLVFIIQGYHNMLWLFFCLALPAAFLSGKPAAGVGLTVLVWLARFYEQGASGFMRHGRAIDYALMMPFFIVFALYLVCEFILKKLPDTESLANKLLPVLKTVAMIILAVVLIGTFVFWCISWGNGGYPSMTLLTTITILTAYALLYSGILDSKAGLRKVLAWIILVALAVMFVFALADLIVYAVRGYSFRTIIHNFAHVFILFFLNVPAFFYVFYGLEYDNSVTLKAKLATMPKPVPVTAPATETVAEKVEEVKEATAEKVEEVKDAAAEKVDELDKLADENIEDPVSVVENEVDNNDPPSY